MEGVVNSNDGSRFKLLYSLSRCLLQEAGKSLGLPAEAWWHTYLLAAVDQIAVGSNIS